MQKGTLTCGAAGKVPSTSKNRGTVVWWHKPYSQQSTVQCRELSCPTDPNRLRKWRQMEARRAAECKILIKILEKQKENKEQSPGCICCMHSAGHLKRMVPPQQPYCPHDKPEPFWYPWSLSSSNVQAQGFPQALGLGEGRMLAQAFGNETGQFKVPSPACSRGVGQWLGTFFHGTGYSGSGQVHRHTGERGLKPCWSWMGRSGCLRA